MGLGTTLSRSAHQTRSASLRLRQQIAVYEHHSLSAATNSMPPRIWVIRFFFIEFLHSEATRAFSSFGATFAAGSIWKHWTTEPRLGELLDDGSPTHF